MIASLYQSWSPAAAVSGLVCVSTSASIPWRDVPDCERKLGWVETDTLQLAAPSECDVAHQIANGDGGIVGKLPFPQRHLDRDLVRVKWIEIDGDQDHVSPIWRGLAVKHDLIVKGRIEPQPAMAMQRRIALSNPVQLGDVGRDIARGIEAAHPNFVFFGIQIFLAARQRGGLAQLEAGIH